jgi:hypothetical protein
LEKVFDSNRDKLLRFTPTPADTSERKMKGSTLGGGGEAIIIYDRTLQGLVIMIYELTSKGGVIIISECTSKGEAVIIFERA